MYIYDREISIREEDEFIKLGQALKKAGLVEPVDAKMVIQDRLVMSIEVEVQRQKLH